MKLTTASMQGESVRNTLVFYHAYRVPAVQLLVLGQILGLGKGYKVGNTTRVLGSLHLINIKM